MRSKHPPRCRLCRLESLEHRLLMAGDVSVAVRSGDLTVRGDAEDNQVYVAPSPLGGIRVAGRDGTTINGAAFVDFRRVRDGVSIRMTQGGEDQITIAGPLYLPDDLNVTMGDGAFTLDGTVGRVTVNGDLSVHAGDAGNVSILNRVVVAGRTNIVAGGTVHVVAGRATLPSLSAATFSESLTIDNPYFPLVPGTTYTYQSQFVDGDTGQTVGEQTVVEVLSDTRTIQGIEARVVRDRVYRDGVPIEDTFDWYAQDDGGNVWYLGEIATNFEYDENGVLVGTNNDGTWETGVDGAKPGVQMAADPQAGQRYYQEFRPGIAIDQAQVLATDETWTVPVGTFDDVLRTLDTTVLEPDAVEHKFYAPGLGRIAEQSFDEHTGEVDKTAWLVSVERNGQPVTSVVPADQFSGTNAVGTPSEGVAFHGAAAIRAGGDVFVHGAAFHDESRIRSGAEAAILDTLFRDEAFLQAQGAASLRNVRARDDVTIRGDLDFYVFASTFLDEVEAILGGSDNRIVIDESWFAEFEADGRSGENTFEADGDSFFGELELRRLTRV